MQDAYRRFLSNLYMSTRNCEMGPESFKSAANVNGKIYENVSKWIFFLSWMETSMTHTTGAIYSIDRTYTLEAFTFLPCMKYMESNHAIFLFHTCFLPCRTCYGLISFTPIQLGRLENVKHGILFPGIEHRTTCLFPWFYGFSTRMSFTMIQF